MTTQPLTPAELQQERRAVAGEVAARCKPLTYGSLFSGVGGFDLGFDRAGLRCLWQVEKDDKARAVLTKHWPDVPKYEDVRNVGKENLATVDVVCGGFPCQDLSVAGKREGLAGERSGLWFEFHRIIGELKPRWVVIENVPGLLSASGGRDFATILRGLAECGYHAAWRILDAQYFGLAQRRRRVFIVASLDGSCAEILFESEGGSWDSAPSRETGTRVARTITERFAGASNQWAPVNEADNLQVIPAIALSNRGLSSGEQTETIRADSHGAIPMVAFGGNNTAGATSMAPAVNAHGSKRYDFESEAFVVADPLTGNPYADNKSQHRKLIAATLNSGGNNGGFRTEPGEHLVTAFTERTRSDGRSLETQNDIAYALTNPGNGGRTHSRQIAGYFGVRRLTPTECERLQGFPDDWSDGQNDSSCYRQLGNAVAVPCAEWIARRIATAATPAAAPRRVGREGGGR